MKDVGTLHVACSPSSYTYGSHDAMFTGFTPGVAHSRQPCVNSRYGKLFGLTGGGSVPPVGEASAFVGNEIIEGVRNLDYFACGTGAMGLFDTSAQTGHHLTSGLDEFWYTGSTYGLSDQLAGLQTRLQATAQPVFAFLNIGETNVRYHFKGAPSSPEGNPGIPFHNIDRSAECAVRQIAGVGFADRLLGPLLTAVADSTILVCADHGGCWSEDGLWEHGILHDMTLTVPLLARVRRTPIGFGQGQV
jgi:hypothetical protein